MKINFSCEFSFTVRIVFGALGACHDILSRIVLVARSGKNSPTGMTCDTSTNGDNNTPDHRVSSRLYFQYKNMCILRRESCRRNEDLHIVYNGNCSSSKRICVCAKCLARPPGINGTLLSALVCCRGHYNMQF